MTGLRNGFSESDPVRDAHDSRQVAPSLEVHSTSPVHPASQLAADLEAKQHQRPTNTTGMAELHESIAGLLAARGQWRQAYHHLRSALNLLSALDSPPKVPEQLRHEVDRLRRERAEAHEQSRRDSLTASYNRRYLDEHLANLITKELGAGLAIALVDLDWFKQVNDTYGHLLGDRVLQRVVEVLQGALPGDAFCARYGGEEFVLVIPAIDADTAVEVCETSRSRIERFPWSQMAPGLRVTVSIGLAHESRASEAEPAPIAAEQQLLSADALLYAAKQSGRNTVAYRAGNQVRLANQSYSESPNNISHYPAGYQL